MAIFARGKQLSVCIPLQTVYSSWPVNVSIISTFTITMYHKSFGYFSQQLLANVLGYIHEHLAPIR